METTVSVASKPVLKKYIVTQQLNHEMLDAIYDYSLTLRVSESTKELYLQRLRMFGLWLMKQGIKRFIGVEEVHINCFLATYDKNNTKNGYITALRPFYRDFLNKPNVVEVFKLFKQLWVSKLIPKPISRARLLKGSKGFFIMDDPFIKADIERLQKQIEIIKGISKSGWQIMYFTAKDEVKDVLKKDMENSKVNYIEVQGVFS